ncbi:MAG: hypothetical protein SangKO_027900 [Sandaracinaceae bacterium]
MRARRAVSLLALGAMATAGVAEAQAPRAAVILDWEAGGAAIARATLRANLMGRGFEVLDDDAVGAARAFAGAAGPLDDASAAALRGRLGVDALVWVTVRAEGERWLVALRWLGSTSREAFGAVGGAQDAVTPRLLDLMDQVHPEEGPPESASSAPAATADATSEASAAPASGAVPAGAPSPASSEPTEPATATAAPAAATASPPGPAVAVTTSNPDAGSAAASAPASSAPPPAPPDEAVEDDAVEDTTHRVRLAIVGVAGVEAWGYGLGLRLELPLASAMGGVDDALSLGLDAGVGYVTLGLDESGNGFEAISVPVAASLSWRFRADDVVVTPRLGGAMALRIGQFTGDGLSGERVSLAPMGLVGLSVAGWVGDEAAQLFAAADLALAETVALVLAAGVAL